MATDLKKMVEDWTGDDDYTYKILKALAAEIKANREEIEKLKTKLSKVHSHGPKV